MRNFAVILATAMAASSAAAQQPVNQTIRSAAAGTVEIQNTSGEVNVVGWDRSEIRITGELGAGAERLGVEGDSVRMVIRVITPQYAGEVKGTRLEIYVPARKDVTVRTVSAEIRIDRLTGTVDGRSVSGDVLMAGSPSRVMAASTSGDVVLNVSTSQILSSTMSGDIEIAGTVRQSVSAESVSGDVSVNSPTPDLTARTVSGDLQLSGASRRVTATTVSGDADIRAGRIQYGSFETVSGQLRFQGDLQPNAALDAKSHSGNVDLVLPAAIRATFQVNSFSGDIVNAFGPAAQRVSQYAPGVDLHFSSGAGGPLISVKTFSGNVRLIKS